MRGAAPRATTTATRMLARQLLFGLIVGIFVCNPQGAQAQFFGNAPRHGSISRANTDAFGRELDFGLVRLNKGLSSSRSVTNANGGIRNGGSTSIANSDSLNGGLNVLGIPIGNTITKTKSFNNGEVSRGIANEANFGNLGIGTSLSKDNLRKGFGLQHSPDGGLSLGLGLLNVGLTDRARNNAAHSKSQADAVGRNAGARAGGNSLSNSRNFGLFGVRDTLSSSNAIGHTDHGRTSAGTSGLSNGAGTNAFTGSRRRRRDNFRGPRARRDVPNVRPKRNAQFYPYDYPEQYNFRPRRQFRQRGWNGGFRPQRGFGGFRGFNGFNGGFQPQKQNANSQGVANNQFNGFQQQAGTNSHSNNELNQDGFFQDNGASSIGSNVADDGSRGQVSSANVAQMNQETADGLKNTNNAQSQSLNFGPNMQQASSSNAGTEHIQDANSERIKANSGSQSTNNNEFGTSSNIANTNSGVVRENGMETVSSDASSQSIFQGPNGGNSGAFTNAKTMSSNGPGWSSNSASSSATANSNGGGPANADSSANAGSFAGGDGGGNAQAGANGWNPHPHQHHQRRRNNNGSFRFPG